MQAVICNGFGATEVLTLQELPVPQPGPDQLLIKVYATALNRADLLQRRGTYLPPKGESAILGLEIAGEVVAWGEHVNGFQVGQRVFGLVTAGGYAQYCLLDQHLALELPEHWDFQTAAAIPEAFITAHQTLFELGGLAAGESVLIHAGGSGVGTASIQMAKYAGAKVYATAGTDAKVRGIQRLGADAGFNYKTCDFFSEIAHRNPQGIDVIQDFIGGTYLNPHLALLKPGGRLIQVALMGSRHCELNLAPLVQKYLQIKGSILRSRTLEYKRQLTLRFKQRWLPVLMAGSIKPIIAKTFALPDIRHAHQFMESNQNFGKIVVTVPHPL